ncbi:MAG: hypothetical protein ACE14T_06315 [Syntrophales bacterium]
MRISVFEIEPWECRVFDLRCGHEIHYAAEILDLKNVSEYRDSGIVSVFIYSKLNSSELKHMPVLKMISTRSTGVDHVDADYQKDIVISNVPACSENTAREHVFGLILLISHRLVESIDRTRKSGFSQKGLQGFDLCGRTLGVPPSWRAAPGIWPFSKEARGREARP